MKMAEHSAQSACASQGVRLRLTSMAVSSRMTTSRLLIIAGLLAVAPVALAAPQKGTKSQATSTPAAKIPLVSTLSPARPTDVALSGARATKTKTAPRNQVLRVADFEAPLFPTSAKVLKATNNARPLLAQNVVPKEGAAAANESLGGMGKVIKVPDLALPPVDKPLPAWMQAASVRVDRIEKTLPQPAQAPNRLAQNPAAPPVRNPQNPVTNSDRLANQIEVAVSTFVVLLTTTDLQTVAVADPNIADVAVVNSRAVLLNGKAAGTTSLVIVDGQKIRQYSVRVLPSPGSRSTDIATEIGIPGVSVRQVRDAVVLTGEVSSAEEARRAEEIAKIYATRVVNQLAIRGQVSQEAGLAAQIRDLIGLPDVSVRVSGDTAILSGTVENEQQRLEAEEIARTATAKVINQLRLPNITVEQARAILGAQAELPTTQPNIGLIGQTTPLVIRESGGQIVLEGSVATSEEAAQALVTARRTGLPVLNRVTVRPAPSPDDAYALRVANAIGRPNIIVRGTATRTILEGFVEDTNEAVLAEQVARSFATQVDNMLRTRNPIQVNVDVSIVEINANDSKSLGIQYGSATLLSEQTIDPTFDDDGNLLTPGRLERTFDPTFNQGTVLGGNGLTGGEPWRFLDAFRVRLNALVTSGKGRVLSNPRTTVLSGRAATFQVGGQVPYPTGSTTNNNGTSTVIEFKDYGILLNIVPYALSNGVTTLRVNTEVSTPDFTTGVTPPGGGSPIPGFRRRSTTTEITVPPNGVVALGGLVTAEEVKNESRVPILSKLPIIGQLFRSKDFRNNKTELVIFVQPRVLPNSLPENTDAPTSVVAVGNNAG